MTTLINLPREMLREIIKHLYYEYKFDISSLGNLSATCRLLNAIMDLNGSNSPVTLRDRARRKHIARVNADKQITQLFDNIHWCIDTCLYTNNNIRVATRELIIKYQNPYRPWALVTFGPLITIEILLDLIHQGVVSHTTKFILSSKSVITVNELFMHGLLLDQDEYKKYFAPLEILTGVEYDYADLLNEQHLSVKFLREYRDRRNLPKYTPDEIRRFCADPEYGDAYARELVGLYNAHLLTNHTWTLACAHININFIINNTHINWNWHRISCRSDITIKLVRDNPQCPWDAFHLSPIYLYDPTNNKHVEMYKLYIQDELCTQTIIDNPNIEWRWEHLAGTLKVDARLLMQQDVSHFQARSFMLAMSYRNDIELSIVLENPNARWEFSELKFLKKYRCEH